MGKSLKTVVRLRECWQFLRCQSIPVRLSRTRWLDLFVGFLDVLAMAADTAVQSRLFHHVQRQFPDLDYYDADIPVSVQYAAWFDLFPTLRCRVTVDGDKLLKAAPLDSRWQLDNSPPLRVLTIAPKVDPAHRPHLRQHVRKTAIPFNPGRDGQRPYRLQKAGRYFTYGMVCAKETAESLGYEVVLLYVDGLWVKRKGVKITTAVCLYGWRGQAFCARKIGLPTYSLLKPSFAIRKAS